ncbi:uncharacterized protein [Miscanthus floridulus]|uniref:uncharacterized protein isoform X2 n=1 Tax=Miscanthus floridulus TaxID=154761 RepID=UPI00345A86DD
MSSSGLWAEDQGSRPHQRVRRTSMQAAKLSEEDGVSSSQPPELEGKSSQAKTAKSGIYMLVYDAVRRLGSISGLMLVQELVPLELMPLVVALWSILFPFLSLQQLTLVLALVLVLQLLVPVQTLHRIMNLCRACMHGHGGRLVKWGPHEWVLDSGAWNHHTSNLALLLEGGYFQSQELDNKDAPSSGDDATAPHVQGRGSIRTECFDFPGVHYVVGDDTRNVVSVSQLARDHGLVTVFKPTSCHVKEKKTGKIVGMGRLRHGMYILDSLHIVGQHIRDGGASGGDRHDGAHGGGGGNGDGDSTAEGRGGGGRDGRGGGGTGARNQEESSGSGAVRGDINEINEEGEGGDEKEIEEMDDNDEDDIKEIGEINGKGEKEDDEKRGGQNSGQLHTGLFGMSRLDCIWWIVSILCIAACILQPYTGWGAGVTILPVDFQSLARFWVLFILSFQLLKTPMSTICKEEETLGPYLQELSPQEHNKRLFGLSRFDAIMNFCRACMHGHGCRLLKWGPHEWVLDSGAWNHHTSNLALLLEGGYFRSHELDNKDAPSSGDDATAPQVQGRGSVQMDCFDFPGVHYVVGDDTRNVVSVSLLARDHGLVTVFEPTSCHIKEKKTGKIVGKGCLRNGMYILDSLHIVGQHIRDGGASGGDRHDGADGGGGGNGDGDSTAEGRAGGGRDGRGGEGGAGARNKEESSGSGAARGDINEINEEGEGGDKKEIEEMDDNDEDDIKEIGEINGKGEKEDDEKRGGQNSGQLSSRWHTGLFGMSRLDCIWWIIVSILCIAACILQLYTGWGVHSLVAGFCVLFLSFHLFKTWMSPICKEEETLGPYPQELSHQEHYKRLFGLSRFDATMDPTGSYHLPAGAFPASSTNAARHLLMEMSSRNFQRTQHL